MDIKETARISKLARNNTGVVVPTPLFIFDSAQHALTGPDGQNVKLRSQSLQVFLLLLENANNVVGKDKILKEVWQGISVTDDSITQCIVDIRRVLGKEHRALLQTIPKVGYRLSLGADESGTPIIGPLGFQKATQSRPLNNDSCPTTLSKDAKSDAQLKKKTNRSTLLISGTLVVAVLLIAFGYRWLTPSSSSKALPLPQKGPTLAILPFENVGNQGTSDPFGDGITEDIIALLSRFSELGIVSWRAVASRAADDASQKAIAEEFGVRYLIAGSVRHNNERVRVAVRLTDARDGHLLWSDRYDERMEDVFSVQDRIAKQIVTTLAVKLTKIETDFIRTEPTSNMAAYQLSLLGRVEHLKRTREGNIAARAHFEKALSLDPNYVDAYIRLGETHLEEAIFGWTEWPERSIEKAMELGRTAIELAGANARSLGLLAQVNIRTGQFSKAQNYLDRAFAFNQNDPALHEIQGLLFLWHGKAKQAIEHLEFVLRYDSDATMAASHLCAAYYVAGRPVDAIATIERTIETAPNSLFQHIIMTAALVEVGDLESAKDAAKMVRRRHPFLTAEKTSKTEFFSNPDVRKRFITSLNRAGIE